MPNPRNRNAQIQQHIQSRDFPALLRTLQSLSHSEFRVVSNYLADSILPTNHDCFWEVFMLLVPTHPRAYLGTFLKAAATIVKQQGEKFLFHPLLAEYATEHANHIDRQKCLEALLPLVKEPQSAEHLLQYFSSTNPGTTAVSLYRSGTPLAYFHLFKYLKTVEDDAPTLRRYALALIKRGDAISFNMARVIQDYFALDNLPATFSMRLQPYQLARLDQSLEGFMSIIGGDSIEKNSL